jgi:cyclase
VSRHANGRVVKGVHFVDIRDAGDPVESAQAYCRAGADELALLDITATVEGRGTMLDVVRRVAKAATVPFTVGGGISDVASAAAVLEAGLTDLHQHAAFRKPEVIAEMVKGPRKGDRGHRRDQNPAMPSGYGLHRRRPHCRSATRSRAEGDSFGVPVILPTSRRRSQDRLRRSSSVP